MQKTMSPGTPAVNHPSWTLIEQKLEQRFGGGSRQEKWARYAIGARLMNNPDRVRAGLLMLTETEQRDVRIICAEFDIQLGSAA